MGVQLAIGLGVAALSAGASYYVSSESQRKSENAANDAAASLQRKIAEPPPVMPVADDAAVQKARSRSLTEQSARRGRASTIMSQGLTGDDNTQKLGG